MVAIKLVLQALSLFSAPLSVPTAEVDIPGPGTYQIATTTGHFLSIADDNRFNYSQVIFFSQVSSPAQKWIFHPAPGLKNTFQIESLALPGAYHSPAVGPNGDTEGSQAVIIFNSTNTVPSYNIQIHPLGGLLFTETRVNRALTEWPTLINQGPITHQFWPDSLFTAQKFTVQVTS